MPEESVPEESAPGAGGGGALAVPPGDSQQPGAAHPQRRRRRRRWPWVLGAVVVLLGALVLVTWLTTNRAHEVSMRQAEQQLGILETGGKASLPTPGVYDYVGSGVEKLSLPPLSQNEGPTIPGTVTLRGHNCFVFKVDYNSHHWQTWDYCLHQRSLWEAGGLSWQLWSIGPINVTNLSNFTCVARSMAVPAGGVPGEQWHSQCRGTNTSVKGVTISAGPYRLIGYTTLRVGGVSVPAAHYLRLRTDSGAQNGTEDSQEWFDLNNGLPLLLEQRITVTSQTPFGTSTYTQVGTLRLVSLVAHR